MSEYSDSPREPQVRLTNQRSCSPNLPPVPDHGLAAQQEETTAVDHHEETSNPRKRKLNQSCVAESLLALDEICISDHLPSQPLLEKVVDYFCVTFHHWVPCLHKDRLQKSVRRGVRDPALDLVLHALIAANLRHMDPNVLFLDQDQIQRQTRVSRYIVENFAMKTVSLESLQALIMIVFDYVSKYYERTDCGC